MSYNLYAEGDLDLFALSKQAQHLTLVELFPIAGDGGPTALGIAVPSIDDDDDDDDSGDDARDELEQIVTQLLAIEATVFDLMTGEQVTDVPTLLGRVFG